MTIKFTGRHFPSEIILQSVRYYLSYRLSYREIEEILAERGINVDHSTLNRWVIKYAPLLEHRARQVKKRRKPFSKRPPANMEYRRKWLLTAAIPTR
jgi:putative transposase